MVKAAPLTEKFSTWKSNNEPAITRMRALSEDDALEFAFFAGAESVMVPKKDAIELTQNARVDRIWDICEQAQNCGDEAREKKLTRSMKRVMALAQIESERTGVAWIGTSELLVAMHMEGKNTGALLMEEHGVTLDQLRTLCFSKPKPWWRRWLCG